MRIRFAPWHRGAVDEILRAWSLGGLVLLALVAYADWAYGAGVKGESEIVVPINRLAAIPLEIDADESEYKVVGLDCDAFREYDPDPKKLKLRVIGYKDTTAWVVVSSQKGGKLQPMFVVRVTVVNGSGPTPPVPPKPDPIPPTPDDPDIVALAASIKAAAAKDQWSPSKLNALSIGFSSCVAVVNKTNTVKELMALCKQSMQLILNGENVAPSVYEVLSAQLNAGLPRQPEAAIDPVAATKLFLKLSKACERAAK